MLTVLKEGALRFRSEDGPAVLNYHIFDNKMLVAYNAFDFGAELIREAEKLDWQQSKVVGADMKDHYSDTRTSSSVDLWDKAPLERFNKKISALVLAGRAIMQSAGIGTDCRGSLTGTQLLRYEPGQFFDMHVDRVEGNSVLSARALSFLGYPNDDYTGGEIVFPEQKLKFKPPAGSIFMFPSGPEYPHASLPVISGKKYSIVTWLNA